MAFGIYLHIPYCHSKCRYCDFYSTGGNRSVPDSYVDALVRALRDGKRPDTLYFGGGTPSLLTPAQAHRLIRAAEPLPGAEITLEANPETLTPALLDGFLSAGVNRLSIGVQTADDAHLRQLGRLHSAVQARDCFAWARDAGFQNLSGDIMLALPGYTTSEFDRTLDLIVEGGAVHVSAYLLKIEQGSAFGRRPPAGIPDSDRAADLYLYAVQQLAGIGFEQYEISNFARPGFQGRHNLIYWNCEDYLGLGPSAHSCIGGKRSHWPSDTVAFFSGATRPQPDGECTAADYIMLRLRLAEGLDLSVLKSRWDKIFSPAQMDFMRRCVQAGYAVLDHGVFRLTPAGMLVQNSILCELI